MRNIDKKERDKMNKKDTPKPSEVSKSRALQFFENMPSEEQKAFVRELKGTSMESPTIRGLKMKVVGAMLKTAPHQAAMLKGLAELVESEDNINRTNITLSIIRALNNLTRTLLELVEGIEGD